MPNPWVLLGSLVVVISLIVGAFGKGEEIQKTADIAAAATAQNKAVADANVQSALNYQTQLAHALAEQKNELSHHTHSRAVAVALAADPIPASCDLSPDALGVLIGSVQASNGAEPTDPASGGHAGLPASDAASGRVDASAGVRPGQHGVDPVLVPPGTQGTARVGN